MIYLLIDIRNIPSKANPLLSLLLRRLEAGSKTRQVVEEPCAQESQSIWGNQAKKQTNFLSESRKWERTLLLDFQCKHEDIEGHAWLV